MTALQTPAPSREWPDVDRLPDRPARAAIARWIMGRAVRGLPLSVVGDGLDASGAGTSSDPVLRLHRPDAFFDRLGDSGLIGFGEAYMAGDWDAGGTTDQVVDTMTVLAGGLDRLVPPWMQRLRRLGIRRQPASEANTPTGSRRNIARHYDLSNDLFASFLDPTMTYSSALFDRIDVAGQQGLQAGQERKIDRLLDVAGVGPGTSLLEIGTGWGELAARAASRGATVRSITLSAEQRDLAQRKVADAGLADWVRIDLCDYRDLLREPAGRYDAVVSVEMIEAVGADYWPDYFATLHHVLASGGVAAIQAITMPHDRMLATVGDYTWIHKYIFPGGMVPSVEALGSAADRVGLDAVDDVAFGADYATTLRLWRHRFEQACETGAAPPGFADDPIFRRMWTFYLAYAEAGFRAGYLDVHHLAWRRP